MLQDVNKRIVDKKTHTAYDKTHETIDRYRVKDYNKMVKAIKQLHLIF